MNMTLSNSNKYPRFSTASIFGVDHLVDTKTAAKVLGLRNHHTLEVWRSSASHSELRFFRIGRAIRYDISDLQAFLAANAIGGVGAHSLASRDEHAKYGGALQ
jgi:hypothetical protein